MWNAQAIMARVQHAVNAGVYAGAIEAARTVREDMGGTGGTRDSGVLGSSRNSYTSSAPGGPPGVRSGNLRNSIDAMSPEELGTPSRAAYGTNVAYGRHLEFGAYPRAKAGKYLTIPLHGKAESALIRAGGSVRNIPGLFFIRTMKGQLFLARKYGGKRARVELWFILKKSVRIAARPWAFRPVTVHRERILAAIHNRAHEVMGVPG